MRGIGRVSLRWAYGSVASVWIGSFSLMQSVGPWKDSSLCLGIAPLSPIKAQGAWFCAALKAGADAWSALGCLHLLVAGCGQGSSRPLFIGQGFPMAPPYDCSLPVHAARRGCNRSRNRPADPPCQGTLPSRMSRNRPRSSAVASIPRPCPRVRG